MSNITRNVLDQSYFDMLDGELTNTYEVNKAPALAGKIAPNPATDAFELSFKLPEAAELSLVIYDITGKAVNRIPARRFQIGQHTLPITLQGTLAKSGVYIVSLQSASGQSNFKLIKR